MSTPENIPSRSLYAWCATVILIGTAMAVATFTHTLAGINVHLYDEAIRTTQRPAAGNIVIIQIDERSLRMLGRWPWRRSVHAALLSRLAGSGVRSVGLDLVFEQPDVAHPEDDEALRLALTKLDRVVLPAVPGFLRAQTGDARVHAAPQVSLGHIHLNADPDGISRSVYLREEIGGKWFDHFAVSMLGDGGTNVRATGSGVRTLLSAAGYGAWEVAGQAYFPFRWAPGAAVTYSFVDVLEGAVPASAFRDRYVLVGATAPGLGDGFATPIGRVNGVELIAMVMNTLETGSLIASPAAIVAAAVSVCAVLVAALLALLLSPRRALACNAVLMLALIIGSFQCLAWRCLWVAPTAPLLGVALVQLVWSWCQQEAALRYLSQESQRLIEQPGLLVIGAASPPPKGPDPFENKLSVLHYMISRVSALSQFLSDGLNSLSEPTLVCDARGSVIFCNAAALQAFERVGMVFPNARDESIATLLDELFNSSEAGMYIGSRLLKAPSTAQNSGALSVVEQMEDGIELTDQSGRDMLLRTARLRTTGGSSAGLVVHLIDITSVRRAERQREEVLRFLSHDMRAPLSAILALVELQEDARNALPVSTFTDKVSHYARRALQFATDFIELAHAQSHAYHTEDIDLAEICAESTEAFWAQANSRHITIEQHIQVDEAPFRGDRFMLLRAMENLVGNAVKFSDCNGLVSVSLHDAGRSWVLAVRDQGCGIPRNQQERLFRPFQRIRSSTHRSHPEGTGLGLLFVKTVGERHRGHIEVESESGQGARFSIHLPKSPDVDTEPTGLA